VSGIKRRLRALEGNGGKCPECGGPWQPGDPVEYEIVWEPAPTEEEIRKLRSWYEAGMPEEESPPEPEDEYCPRCGRQTLVVIDWPDALPPGELKRREAEQLARRGWSLDALLNNEREAPQDRVPDYPPEGWSGDSPNPPSEARGPGGRGW
jgi:hypothetical protein